MPRLVQLQERYPNQVHCISLNVDFDEPGEPSAKLTSEVHAVVQPLGASCEHIMCGDSMEDTLNALEVFGLPAALVYDKSGKLAGRFDGSVDYDSDIHPLVEKLVKLETGGR